MDSSALPTPEQPTASTNAAAIADLLGNPTAQREHVSKRPRRRRIWLLLLLPILLAGVFLSPRLLEFLPDTNQVADLTGMPLYTVQRRDLQITVTEEGSLVSDENVDITCDVAGGATIIWLVDDGDRVDEGMDIVKLDASVLSENATAQKIAYEKARALMIQADKDYAAAKIAVEEYWTRLWGETERSVKAALYLREQGIEINTIGLDFNSDKTRKSNKLVKASIGYVESFGFKARIKPDMLPAISAADGLAR